MGEIETALARSGLTVSSAAFIARKFERPTLACAFVAREGISIEQIRAALVDNLPDYMIPQILLPLDDLPVTANGKLDQDALSAFCRPAKAPILSAVSSDTMDLVKAAFEEVLEREIVDSDVSFFSLGGDSLGFQVLLKLIEERTGRRLRFRDVVRNPSVCATAKLIESSQTKVSTTQVPSTVHENPYEPFPLTEMQMAYYIGRNQGFDLGGVGEHFYVEFLTTADIPRLERALNEVIRRHDMLRAVFTNDARQKILAEVPYYTIDVDDLQGLSIEEVEAAVTHRRQTLSHQCFDLSKWPLFHISAMLMPEGEKRLFFSIDMIIGDGASQQIFIRDLTAAYEKGSLGVSIASYRDCVCAIRHAQEQCDSAPFDDETKRLLRDFPLGNVLPSSEDLSETPRMRRLSWGVPLELVENLEERARERSVSLSTVLLYIYAASLALFSREGKVGINVTTYSRDYDIPGIQDVFGDFTGIALVDFNEELADNPLGMIQERLLKQMSSGRSGVKLLTEMGKQRGFTGKVLAPFVFTSLLFGNRDNGFGVLGKVDYAISQTPQVLIDHQVMRTAEGLSISWDYVEQVFSPSLMEAIFDHFKESIFEFAKSGSLSQRVSVESVRSLRAAWSKGAENCRRSAPFEKESTYPPEGCASLIGRMRDWLTERYAFTQDVREDTSLFDGGIDSLGFVQLIQMVQEETGRQLPLAEALSLPTMGNIALLASKGSDSSQMPSSLVLLREGDKEKIVVMVHGGFGTVDIYRDLALGIPRDYQVWGVRFDRFARRYPRHLSIDEIAGQYREEIEQTMDSSANYVVVGWSVGGTLGHALARMLGKRCCGLVLLDSLAPGVFTEVGEFTAAFDSEVLNRAGVAHVKTDSLPVLWEELKDDSATVCRVAHEFSESLFEDLGVSAGQVRIADLSTLRTLIAARNSYQPVPCEAAGLSVIPDDGEAYNHDKWKRYASGVSTEYVKGNHYSFVIGPENSKTIAAVSKFVRLAFAE